MGRCMASPLQGHRASVSVAQGNSAANLYVDITLRYKIIIDGLFPQPVELLHVVPRIKSVRLHADCTSCYLHLEAGI